MELKNQVCNLDLARKLKELGMKQDSYFQWKEVKYNHPHGEPFIFHADIFHADVEVLDKKGIYQGDKNDKWEELVYAAFTVAELGEMLPQILVLKKKRYQLFVSVALDKQWFAVYANEDDYTDNAPINFMMCHSEADARAKMLIYLIENNLLPSPR